MSVLCFNKRANHPENIEPELEKASYQPLQLGDWANEVDGLSLEVAAEDEVMCTCELDDPFRRGPLKKPVPDSERRQPALTASGVRPTICS